MPTSTCDSCHLGAAIRAHRRLHSRLQRLADAVFWLATRWERHAPRGLARRWRERALAFVIAQLEATESSTSGLGMNVIEKVSATPADASMR